MGSSRLFEQLNHIVRKVPQKKLSNALALLLILYLAYLSSTVVWQLVPSENSNGVVQFSSTASTSQNSSSAQNDVSSLLSLNLFGKFEQTKQEAKPVVAETQSAPKTRLNVTLTGLVADASDPLSLSSVAIIESSTGQNTYGVDEKIEGTSADVYQIFIDRVILQVSGRFETLMLEGIEYSTTIPGSENKVDRNSGEKKVLSINENKKAEAKPAKQERIDNSDDLELSQALREQRDELFDDPKKLLDVIRIRPYRKSGELLGYHLSPGKDSKLFEHVGLKRNDLATSINGYDLTDMQQALTVMTELKTMTEATITVVRDDTLIDIILAL